MPTSSSPGNSKTYRINIGENIFECLRKDGLELSHGCLSGSCGACRVEIIKGSKLLEVPNEMENRTLSLIKINHERIHGNGSLDGRIIRLACQANILEDGHLELKELT